MATGKRRYWYAVEWPDGVGTKLEDGSDYIVLWRFDKQQHRDHFVSNGSTLFKSNTTPRTVYKATDARKHSFVFQFTEDGSDYEAVGQ